MSSYEYLGDQAITGTDQTGSAARTAEVEFDVVRTPRAGYEPDGSLGPEATRLALLAMDIFRMPFDPNGEYPDELNTETGHKVTALAEDHQIGVVAIAQGFRFLRHQLGDRPYGGFDIHYSTDKERTDLPEYFDYINNRTLIINHWLEQHDFREHLMGGLLASDEVTSTLQRAAALRKDANLSVGDTKALGDFIDFSISQVRQIWQDFGRHNSHASWLARYLETAFEIARQPLAPGQAEGIAKRQAKTIKDWEYRVRTAQI